MKNLKTFKELFENNGYIKGALEIAIEQNDLEKIKTLISKGYFNNGGIDTIGYSGMSPLMMAASQGRIEIVKEFLNLGANVNLKNKNGKTAKDLTSDNAIIQLLSK